MTNPKATPETLALDQIARIISPDLFVEYDLLVKQGTVAENGKPWAEVVFGQKIAALHEKAASIIALRSTVPQAAMTEARYFAELMSGPTEEYRSEIWRSKAFELARKCDALEAATLSAPAERLTDGKCTFPDCRCIHAPPCPHYAHTPPATTSGSPAERLTGEAGTPAAKWRAEGKTDPHGTIYDCERANLSHGDMTDDEIANAVYLNNNDIGILTAAKERIRWLSRKLASASPALTAGTEREAISDIERAFTDACDEAGCAYDNEALLQAISDLKVRASAQSAWKSIETSPKSRSFGHVRLFGDGEGIRLCEYIGIWSPGEEAWREAYSNKHVWPTHWQPLSAAPAASGADE